MGILIKVFWHSRVDIHDISCIDPISTNIKKEADSAGTQNQLFGLFFEFEIKHKDVCVQESLLTYDWGLSNITP